MIDQDLNLAVGIFMFFLASLSLIFIFKNAIEFGDELYDHWIHWKSKRRKNNGNGNVG